MHLGSLEEKGITGVKGISGVLTITGAGVEVTSIDPVGA
jgi:hypothetical protein